MPVPEAVDRRRRLRLLVALCVQAIVLAIIFAGPRMAGMPFVIIGILGCWLGSDSGWPSVNRAFAALACLWPLGFMILWFLTA
jgi:hypothetical protein